MAKSPVLRQLAYISNRPAVLAETLTYVRHFLPWVTQAVVLTPQPDAMKRAVDGLELDVVVVADSDVATGIPTQHSARNAFLRKALYARGPLDDVFLQSDDDYRPLKPLPVTDFVEGGKLVSYFFYELPKWRRNESSYDGVQHSSYLAMSYLGGPTLAYASHMPQPIDKALFAKAFADAERLAPATPFCEWSLPLNHGRLIAPERWAEPRVFRTICWPQYPHEWPYAFRPEDLAFENFHPEHYEPGHLFDGISTSLDATTPEQQAFSKIQRWYAFDLEAGKLRFPKGVANPWQTTVGRKAFVQLAKGMRKLNEYATFEERGS
ncbi:MAG: hypothetical protein QOG99_190 [Frankiales bacterium]|jgi:hypothetical protein|nr:hypothetical protein [Frankiales bacterium]